MQEISGYKINSQMYESNKTIIYKATREKDKIPVILKVLKKEYPSADELNKFKNEYEILNKIKELPGIIKSHDLLDYKNSLIIVMEDFNGDTLDKIINNDEINLSSFLELARNITVAIGNIHKQQIIHKDIKPYNIIVNKNNEVRIIDFSLSTQITKETQNLINPDKIEGTLSYISPEQTGRMNRSINYRSDYYSMGITFYQMLTGKLPFVSNDPLELVHFHIAKIPQSPHDIDKSIPKPISDIIMKLLSKTAEERYQSVNGLLFDLKKCLDLLTKNGEITNFKIGENDLSENFQVPEKLYGREEEIELLIERFNNVYNGGKEVLFFSGPPGIGKSALVNEIHKILAEKSGFFIEGKFDLYKKNVPYSAIIQSFSMLAKQILTESEENIKNWKGLILERVGNIGKIITDVVPDFELIIGRQPEVQELPPTEAQNRFNMLVQNFIKVFARENQPLVMFIDDMQWIDDASMKLLEKSVGDRELNNFLFIGSYRDNEVDQSHPLTRIMAKMDNRDEISREYIKLTPLDGKYVAQLLSDTFYLDIKKTKDLANILIEKTDGNPFFINTFLKTLVDEKLIRFENGWQWDISKIKNANVTSNVVELMANRIKKLDKTTWEILKIVACFGGKFTINTLSQVYEKNENETFNDIKFAVNEGMILKIGDDYKFVHDRVKEAALSLIEEKELESIHYKIGITLLKNGSTDELESIIFDIASQLNSCKNLLKEEEKEQLIEINLKAEYRAKKSGAFDAALRFLNEGVVLLSKTSWETTYSRTLSYYTEKLELEFLNGNLEEADKYFELVLSNATNILDKIKIYEIKIVLLTSTGSLYEAINLGKKALKLLKITIPEKISKLALMKELIISKFILGKKDIEKLINLPEMKDDYKLASVRLLKDIIAPALFSKPELAPILVIKIVILSLKYGNSMYSSFAYAMFAMIHNVGLNDLDSAFKFGSLALKLIEEKFFDQKLRGQVYFLIGNFIWHWKYHAREGINFYMKGLNNSYESGDFPWAAYNINFYLIELFFLGTNLEKIYSEYENYRQKMIKFKVINELEFFNLWNQIIKNLKGDSANKIKLKSKTFNADEYLPIWWETKNYATLFGYYLFNALAFYLYEDYEKSLENIEIAEKIKDSAGAAITIGELNFISSLTLCAIVFKTNNKKKEYLKKVIRNQTKLKLWADSASQNFNQKYLLIKAEIEKINNSDSSAIKLYEKAISLAKENNFTQDIAIANECAGKFYLSRNLPKIAKAYMIEAKYYYLQWGAFPKVKKIEKKYSNLFENYVLTENLTKNENPSQPFFDRFKNMETSSSSSKSILFDIETIIKATQAISSEIEMKKLLEKLIMIAIENAGAQRGFLILADKNNNLLIEAEGEIDKEEVIVLQSKSIDDSQDISPSIIRYCAKTKKNVVLNNASKEGLFISDEYIIKNKPKSILCTPIIKQTKLVGLLYLENNLTTNAFPEERVEILNILSSQIAISIENSKLIDDLKEQERLKQEMVIAEQIQTSLIPVIPEDTDFEIAATIRPTEEVGGDYFDIIFDNEKNLWFAIGDVSGHGVTPGLIMMMAQTAINSNLLSTHKPVPDTVLEGINRVLYENIRNRIKKSHYMTLSLLKYQGSGDFIYSGLHLDIIIYRADMKRCELVKTSGVYLGIIAEIKKHAVNDSFHLDKNDIMILYTDGIIEAMNDKDQMLGVEGLIDIIEKNVSNNSIKLKETILNKTLEWCNNKVVDDITILVIKRK